MGNANSTPHEQITCKICMKCNETKLLNTELMILNLMTETINSSRRQLLLRCSKGHILLYEGDTEHITNCVTILNQKQASMSEIDELKKEISLLKEEIEFLKKNEPSAPHLLNVELVEAQIIK